MTVRRGGLCVAVAALLPVSTALTGEPIPHVTAAASLWAGSATFTGAGAPAVPLPVEVPPLATRDGDGHRFGKHSETGKRHVTHKRHAVIKTTQHQRIQDISANTSYDVPLAALTAYRSAAARVAYTYPGCHLSWGVIAAIGQVESNHGRFGGASVLADGKTVPRIVGLPLNGQGVARIADTDNGVLDGDKVWDRAVGPMQFIPSTWAGVGADGDGDGRRDPSDFDDAALATGLYLCSASGDFSSLAQARANVLRYNHSDEYVDLVLRIANAYDSGVVDVVPNDPAPPPRHHAHHRHHSRYSHNSHHPRRHPAGHPRRHPPRQHPPSHQTPAHHAPGQQPSDPTRKPQPKPDPKPKPKPKPEPKPVVKTWSGVFDHPGAGVWTVDGVGITFSKALRSDLKDLDLDGNGKVKSLDTELAGLVGGTVKVTTTDDSATAFVVVSLPPSTTESTPSTPAPSAATATTTSAATGTATNSVAAPAPSAEVKAATEVEAPVDPTPTS